MEIKNIEGKEYVEYNSYKVKRNDAIRQTLFLILIAIAIGFLIVGILDIRKNVNALRNPLQENIEKFDIKNCLCFKWDGSFFTVESRLNKTATNVSQEFYQPPKQAWQSYNGTSKLIST
jgi:hypothetical protein